MTAVTRCLNKTILSRQIRRKLREWLSGEAVLNSIHGLGGNMNRADVMIVCVELLVIAVTSLTLGEFIANFLR